MTEMLKRLLFVLTVSLLTPFVFIHPASSDELANREIPFNQYGIRSADPFVVDRFIEDGRVIEAVIVPGPPHPSEGSVRAEVANLPEPDIAAGINTIANVPAMTWVFGCSATSAAMMFGHYDNSGYPNMYAGPTNGGVFPMTNAGWGTVVINGETRALCPLSATRNGLDGRAIGGHVDDYWVKTDDAGPDPFIDNWTEHTPGHCTGDYMGTNQSSLSNVDGGTTFYFNADNSPNYDYIAPAGHRDGSHGMKLFVESRGYTVQSNGNFNQRISGYGGNPAGFTYENFKTEINAGRPVMIQVVGHTMLGYGYSDPSTIYIHDTWDHLDHSMTWGGTYDNDPPRQHTGVTVLRLGPPPAITPLYFPHVDTRLPWQTEIAIINTGDQTVTGTLKGYGDDGILIDTRPVTTLSAHGRKQITVANEFTNHTNIRYIIFDTASTTVQGYTKFYQAGIYRAAVPAVKKINTSVIYIPHIAANAPQWWTGVGLVNTTSVTKNLTITFNTGLSVPYTLPPYGHGAFDIASLVGNPGTALQSAVITNASGVIGLELFGGTRSGGNYLDGILLTDKTASTLYYPHMAGGGWWTGIVAYNPAGSACTITITPYSAQGTAFTPIIRSIPGKGKYIGLVSDLGLPAQTAWFKIDSTSPLSGFELFGTSDNNQLAAYGGGGGTGVKKGVFPKIEKSVGGWTGIAFVNTEALAASVTLTAYRDNGTTAATQVLTVPGHAKVVNYAENIFSQNISTATYIGYSSNRNVVGFQLNGDAKTNGKMLDGLPGLGDAN